MCVRVLAGTVKKQSQLAQAVLTRDEVWYDGQLICRKCGTRFSPLYLIVCACGVSCPYCRAKPGEACRSRTNGKASPFGYWHADRRARVAR